MRSSKALLPVAGVVALVLIVALGWAFFRVNMAAHPLLRACYLELASRHPEGIALLAGRLAVDGAGSRVELLCELKGADGAPREARFVFELAQDPALPAPRPGSNPFEAPSLAISAFTDGDGRRTALAAPIHPGPTPALVHRPPGRIAAMRDGRPVGEASATDYDRRHRFFRHTDSGAGAGAR